MINLGIKDATVNKVRLNSAQAALVLCARSSGCLTLDPGFKLKQTKGKVYVIRVKEKKDA